MEFTRLEVVPAQNKKGPMGLKEKCCNSVIEVQYIERYRDVFNASRCFGLVQMDRFLSTSQATIMYPSVSAVIVTSDHIFITYCGKRYTLSNQFLGREFKASLNERTPPECEVTTLTNREVAQFLRQPAGFLDHKRSSMEPCTIKNTRSVYRVFHMMGAP